MALSKTTKKLIAYADLPTDKRGLLPIDVARKILKTTSTYPGSPDFDGEDEDARQAKDTAKSKQIHAALLSLDDTAEVLGHLTRITWGYPLYDATTLVERYGEAMLPWFAGVLTPEGNLELKAWQIEGALVMLGSEAAFELMLKARAFHFIDNDETRKHPLGDVSKLRALDPKARIDILVENTIDAFMAKHPQVAARVLAKRAATAPKDKRLAALGKRLALVVGGKAALDAAFGARPVEAVTAKAILEVLDAGAGDPAPQAWPKFSTGIEDDPMGYEYFGLRLIGARSKKGEDWGVVLERISGSFSPWEKTR
ncbi:MAG: hypothetical protein H0V17_24150, partial [Deltaproteobacteria bacterium]|nr:hypothetical protein [Deltaproteobacteria bacterium]